MKKKELNTIINRWIAKYARKGVSANCIAQYIPYVERLIKEDLPPIIDLKHLSLLIGIDYLFISKIAHGPEKFYRQFSIPKRSGGERTILAPYPSLLFVQRWICENILNKQKPQFCVHGFVEGRSILTNSMQHQGNLMLLKMDIQDFFGSIPLTHVINYFQKDLGYNSDVSYFLAKICCYKGFLPQGAPTSPSLSNLINKHLDRRLYRLSKQFNLTYTRYADDMVFSGEKIPSIFIQYVSDIVTDCKLTINESKTRLYKEHGNKIITGISLSSGKPKITRDYRRRLHQELNYIGRYGLAGHMRHNKIKKSNYLESLIGRLNFWLFIEPENRYATEMRKNLRSLIPHRSTVQ